MNLHLEIEKFLRLAQAPDTDLVELGQDLMGFKADSIPGVSLDADAIQEAGRAFYSGLVLNQPNNMLKSLKTLLGLTRNGGGELYTRIYQALAKLNKKFAPKPTAPAPQLSNSYYKLLNELTQLSQMSKKTDHDVRQQVKDRFQELQDSLSGLPEYLEFQEATATTSANSSDPQEQAKGKSKLQEIAQFKNKTEQATHSIESMLFDFAGSEINVAGPSNPEEPVG